MKPGRRHNINRRLPRDEVMRAEFPTMTKAEVMAKYGVGRRAVDIRCRLLDVKCKPTRAALSEARFHREVLEEIESGRVDARIESSKGARNRGRCVVEAAKAAVTERLR